MEPKYFVAVVGAGPAGLYAAKQLAERGAHAVIFNRDIKPGGLAEYGIYHTKHRMKAGLRKQFRRILDSEGVSYFGNVTVGENGDFTLDDLWGMGFQAIMVTVGAQGTKWLGLPGEDLDGVYHAKDLVYHYNQLPPYSKQKFKIGKRVALIGVGNVMMDIAHWTIRDLHVDEAIAVARRGPAEVKFDKKEMQNVGMNLDVDGLDAEIERVAHLMKDVDQDPEEAKAFILAGLKKAKEKISDSVFRFEFLSSPCRIVGDDEGKVVGLEIDDTKLILKGDVTKARPLGTKRILDVDTVVFCIGDKVDENFGLPIEWNEFVKSEEPAYPIDDISFEAFNPEAGAPVDGVFVAGWSREASSGLVGYARKDGENGADAMLLYLAEKPEIEDVDTKLAGVIEKVNGLPHPVVDNAGVRKLEDAEAAIKEEKELDAFKFSTNEEMLDVLGL